MADTRKLRLEIINKGGSGGDGAGESGKKKKSGGKWDDDAELLTRILHPIDYMKHELVKKAGSGGVFVRAAEMTANAVKSNIVLEHRRYFNLTENYIGENNLGVVTNAMSTIGGIFASTASMAILGLKTGNPVMALAGAAIGATFGIYNAEMSKLQKLDNYYIQLNSTVSQTIFNASRAALIDNSRGTEN